MNKPNDHGRSETRRCAAIVNYGCAKNLVDSEVMGGHLQAAGYAITADPSRADILILNTCAFIRPSRDEADAGIRAALSLKADRTGVRVVVTGCYPEKERTILAGRFPGVDAWLGVRDYDHIVPAVENRFFRPGRRTFLYDARSPRALSTPASWAYLKVSEGCSHECAFCAIPSIKGRYRSRPISSIVGEARALEAHGIRELVLISQDTTAFGRDRGHPDGFSRLLGELLKKTGLPWIRFLYGYPGEITESLLEVMADSRVCPYFDIPFQHAAPSVLRKMKRATPGPQAIRLIEKIRKHLPEAAIRTSLIVGFPGEGPAEFQMLRDFVRGARFDHLGVFAYCRESGTAADALGDPIPDSEKERRRSVLLETQAKLSAKNLGSFRGRVLEVLLEGADPADPKNSFGRARFQAPEVDGVVFVRAAADEWKRPLRRVKIVSAETYDLRGILVT
ncbi:MAG: 30S ribosomal protein S12 methylthiotransferase RimO [Candidatus Aminicenantales bacterium]